MALLICQQESRNSISFDKKWINLVKKDRVHGLPCHIHSETSWIKVLSSEEWKRLEPTEQCWLLARYILLYVKPPLGGVAEPLLLDAAKRFAYSNQPITTSDFSLPPNDDMSKCQVKTMLQVVAEEAAEGIGAKIMSATNATVATKDCAGMGPVSQDALWFLMSGAWSRSDGHVDAGGGHTIVEMLAGTKYWMVKVPDVDSNSEEAEDKAWRALGDTQSHLNENKDSEPMKGYRWEGLEIQPGSTLYMAQHQGRIANNTSARFMNPHTWHAVITTSPLFATGYHFWNSKTLLGDTFLVKQKDFKDLQHHALDPTSPKDVPQLLALLFLILLDNIFNPKIFKKGRTQDQQYLDRAVYTTHLKGRAWDMVDFLNKGYSWLFGLQLNTIKHLRSHFLKNHLSRTDDEDMEHKDGFAQRKTTEMLNHVLEMASTQARQVETAFLNKEGGIPKHLTSILDQLAEIQTWQAVPDEFYVHQHLTFLEPLDLGACKRDQEELMQIKGCKPPVALLSC
ncbi:hypothetical protein BKA70DRAFT_1224010 [Coprinopsis sp. MPI-PUGE-AT-0042]|nr:hypothetical protein BKA70DRAFT_1224010 [Coprinopsis sp. MPI-PUGE-AT-0042]